MSVIVGFGHVARAGKDTAANALVHRLGFRRVGFADPLKALAYGTDFLLDASRAGFGPLRISDVVRPGDATTWEKAKNDYDETRRFLEALGLAGREVLGADVWVDALLDSLGASDRIVIPDVRYPNEAIAIQARGGIVVRVDRPWHSADPAARPSEAHLLDWHGWDDVLVNDGGTSELRNKAVRLVGEHFPVPVPPAERSPEPAQDEIVGVWG